VKRNYRLLLALFLISAFSLWALGTSVCLVDGMRESTFQKAELKDLRYDEVYDTGFIRGGSEVSLKIILTNVSKEVKDSTLQFQSDLEGAIGSVSGEGLEEKALQTGGSYKLVHGNVVDEVVISWSGEAPKVGIRSTFTLLNITQETTEGVYLVFEPLAREVSSEVIEDAIDAFNNANASLIQASKVVEAAEEQGLDVSDALISLELATEHLDNSQQLYFEGRAENATAEAGQAIRAAQEAEAKAAGAVGGRTYRNYAIIGAIIVVLLVVVLVFLQQRRRKRGVY